MKNNLIQHKICFGINATGINTLINDVGMIFYLLGKDINLEMYFIPKYIHDGLTGLV